MAALGSSAPLTMSCERIWDEPEVHVIRIPFIRLGLEYTNCYVVRDGDDALIIDTGVSAPLASRAFIFIANEIGIDLSKARFLATHLHFDHVDLLKQLVQPGSRILLSETAYYNNPWRNCLIRKEKLKRLLQEEGVPFAARRGLAAIRSEVRICDLPGCEYELLREGDLVRIGAYNLRVIETFGHTDGHISLYLDGQRILFSGDHVLKGITPGLAMPLDGMDSLRMYLNSLSKVEGLACAKVLPGHGEPFANLAERCAELRKRHERRLNQVFEVIAENPGINGHRVTRAMPWKAGVPVRDWEKLDLFKRIAMGAQTFSYLEFLVNIGQIEREQDSAGRHYRIC